MQTPLLIAGGIVLLFVLLLCLRVRVVFTYRDTIAVRLSILCFTVRIYPRKQKVNLKKYSPQRAARAAKRAARRRKRGDRRKEQHQSPKKRPLRESVRLLRGLVATLLRSTKRHLRLHVAHLDIRVATGDAAKTAVLYGAVSGAVAHLIALLDRVTAVKAPQKSVCVRADFLSERSCAHVKLVFSISVGGALASLFSVMLSHLRRKEALKTAARGRRAATDRKNTEISEQKGIVHHG